MKRPKPSEAIETAKRCAIYTRKSTSAGLEQAFNSLDAQREACASYIARQQGWSALPALYDDGGFTGANIDRPAFQRLLADVEAGRVDIVVVYKVDRFSRSLSDFVKVLERLHAAGASFVSVTQNFSTADAMGRLTLNVLISFAEFEREMIAERTRDKVTAARRKGKWTGGPVPLGYRLEAGKLAVEPTEAGLVGDIFAAYLRHRSLVRLVTELNERGRTTKSGRRWTKDAVLRILKNPIYAGLTRIGTERHAGEHTAIIDPAEAERVNEQLGRPAHRALNRRGEGDCLLRGLARCGGCGAALIVETARRGARVYRYLRCETAQKKGAGACPAPARVPAKPIDDAVVDAVRRHATRPGFAADVRRATNALIDKRRATLTAEAVELPRTIGEGASRVHALASAIADAAEAARRPLTRRLDEHSAILAAQERRLAEVTRELRDLEGARAEAEWVAASLERFDAIWDVLSGANRVRLVHALVRRVVVDVEADQVQVELAVGLGSGSTATAQGVG